MRYFVALAEFNGYREAARRLHIAQPAITQAVIDLEAEIGVSLVDRKVRPPKLTRAGETFLVSAKALLDDADQALQAARRIGRGATGTLRVGFIPFATHHVLPKLLRRFKEAHPSVELDVRELTPAAQWKAFSEDAIDVGFTREPTRSQRARLSCSRLFDVPLIAIVRNDWPHAEDTLHVSHLADRELILLPRRESPALFDAIVALCRASGFSPIVNSFPHLAESMVTLVEAGQGIAILPAWAKNFASARLRCIPLEPSTARAELVIAWNTGRETAEATAFLDLIRASMPEIEELTDRMVAP